jgi:hypothetical protein
MIDERSARAHELIGPTMVPSMRRVSRSPS